MLNDRDIEVLDRIAKALEGLLPVAKRLCHAQEEQLHVQQTLLKVQGAAWPSSTAAKG